MPVLGVNELLARFVRAGAVAETAKVETVRETGQDVAILARTLAPRDTGRLADSITYEDGRVFTDVEYAAYQEYGTSQNDAHPYMRSAADAVENSGQALAVGAAILRNI